MVIAPIVRQSYGRPHRRSASSSSPALLSRGPQRFFHDTRTYTGVHSSGGPDHANRDSFVLSLRAGQHGHQGSSFSDTPGLQKRQLSDRCSTPFTEADMRSLRGPERFFYDKTTYTGIHARGGPKVVNGPGTWLRPSHNAGSTFTNNSGHPLNNDSTMRLSGSSKSQPVAGRGKRPQSAPPGRSTSAPARTPSGPERFYYDQHSYTGVCAHAHTQWTGEIIDRDSYVGATRLICSSAVLAPMVLA